MNRSQIQKINEIRDAKELAKMRHSQNINDIHEESLSLGDRIADKMADFAGSWTFIISFALILLLWVIFNSIQLILRPFDPFPFILLNLVLSCIAAMQAPIIMMSQNRQEAKDRIRAKHDYEIDLKSEILIEDIIKRLDRIEENQKALMDKQKEACEYILNLKS